MSAPKKTIDAHANREMPKSDGLAHAVMQLIESPHIVNLNTEIDVLKAEHASLQTDHDTLHAENIVQREDIIAGHNALRRLMGEKDRIIDHLTQSKDGEIKLLEKQYSDLSALYDGLMKYMNEEGRFASQEGVIKSTFGADGANALEVASATSNEESDTYVGKCLECGEVLSSDTRQLCGKYVCHNA